MNRGSHNLGQPCKEEQANRRELLYSLFRIMQSYRASPFTLYYALGIWTLFHRSSREQISFPHHLIIYKHTVQIAPHASNRCLKVPLLISDFFNMRNAHCEMLDFSPLNSLSVLMFYSSYPVLLIVTALRPTLPLHHSPCLLVSCL